MGQAQPEARRPDTRGPETPVNLRCRLRRGIQTVLGAGLGVGPEMDRRLRSSFSSFLRLLFQASCLGVLISGVLLSSPLGVMVMVLVIALARVSSRIPFT